MKYKVGDKVMVRKDLEADYYYNSIRFVEGMAKFKGQIVTIKGAREYGPSYMLEEDPNYYYWTDEMFTTDFDVVAYAKREEMSGYDEKSYLKGKCDAYEEILEQIFKFNRKD